MTEQEKSELHSETLQYLGKTLNGSGTKTDGNPWKKWKISFNTGKTYPWQAGAFDSISDKGVQVKDMIEGDYYEVVYKWTEFQSKEHGKVKSKQAVLIKNAEPSQSTQDQLGKAKTENNTTNNNSILEVKNWEVFRVQYNAQMNGETRDPLHMLGAYINHAYKEECGKIIETVKGDFLE